MVVTLKNRAADDKQSEKLRERRKKKHTNAELLAILIGSGTPKKDAVTLMQEILSDCNDQLNTLSRMSLNELQSYCGIGEAKSITLKAACELGSRIRREEVVKRLKIQSAETIATYTREELAKHQRENCATYAQTIIADKYWEEAHVLLLNQRLELIKSHCISKGGISETSVDVRLILREALLATATHLVLCHNHPSGSPRPSREDDRLTENVKRACETMRLTLLDHVIVGDRLYYSYADEGRL